MWEKRNVNYRLFLKSSLISLYSFFKKKWDKNKKERNYSRSPVRKVDHSHWIIGRQLLIPIQLWKDASSSSCRTYCIDGKNDLGGQDAQMRNRLKSDWFCDRLNCITVHRLITYCRFYHKASGIFPYFTMVVWGRVAHR